MVGFVMDSKRLLIEALRLHEEERAYLAVELIDGLDSETDSDAEAAWAAEIRARVNDIEAGRAKRVPWAEAGLRIAAAARRGHAPETFEER
jgi:putative addiction module component (TIGR02574 family)